MDEKAQCAFVIANESRATLTEKLLAKIKLRRQTYFWLFPQNLWVNSWSWSWSSPLHSPPLPDYPRILVKSLISVISPHPFTTPIGLSRATIFAIPLS